MWRITLMVLTVILAMAPAAGAENAVAVGDQETVETSALSVEQMAEVQGSAAVQLQGMQAQAAAMEPIIASPTADLQREIGDHNGNGIPDVTTHNDDGTVVVEEVNNDNDTTTTTVYYDENGDGQIDHSTTTMYDDTDGNGVLEQATISDIDGDGIPDIVVITEDGVIIVTFDPNDKNDMD